MEKGKNWYLVPFLVKKISLVSRFLKHYKDSKEQLKKVIEPVFMDFVYGMCFIILTTLNIGTSFYMDMKEIGRYQFHTNLILL